MYMYIYLHITFSLIILDTVLLLCYSIKCYSIKYDHVHVLGTVPVLHVHVLHKLTEFIAK